MFIIPRDVKGHKERELSKGLISLKRKQIRKKSTDFSCRSINYYFSYEKRYLIIKNLYTDYVILIKDKNNNYISFNEDEKIIHYFGIKDVNTIYLNNLEIEEKYEYENNKYNELYLKVKIIEILEVLCKKELEQ